MLTKNCLLFHSFYILKTKYKKIIGLSIGILFTPVLIPKLLNNLLVSCTLINLDCLLPHTVNFDQSIGVPFF